MKKALLLLFFIFSFSTYAQPPGLLNPYNLCDDAGNDGYTSFNLVSTDPIGSLGLNPAIYTVAFYPSVADANTNTNVITNPSAYINEVVTTQIIGVRFVNTNTSEVNVSGMELTVFAQITPTFDTPSPICYGQTMMALPTASLQGFYGTWSPAVNNTATTTYTFIPDLGQCATSVSLTIPVYTLPIAIPGSLTFCDPIELPIYYLPNADAQITGGVAGTTVSYFLTQADAQNNSNPLDSSFIPTVDPGTQVLYARVVNGSGCSSITTLTLYTQICNDPCLPPTQLTASSITAFSAMLGWTSNNAETIQWHVLVLPSGSPAPIMTTTGWTAISINPLIYSGLNPNTSYDVYVRSVCTNISYSEWSNPITFTTQFAPPVCGGNFLDQGGSTGNYSDNSNYVTTICPTSPGDAVSVTFQSFNTETNVDALYVYNGNSVAAPLIPSMNAAGNIPGSQPGGYWGNTIPGPFTSSSVDGCLTFQFLSDTTINLEGWVANVNCIPQVCDAPTNLAIANLTETAVYLSWDNISNANAYEVYLLSYGSPSPTLNDHGVSVGNNPLLLTNLIPDQCYTAYVRSSCGFSSDWSSPVNFCMFNCANNAECSESLVLNAFLDSNNNGLKDSGEINFPNGNFVYQINDSGINLYGSSNNGPYYIFDSNTTNSYDLSFTINNDLNAYYSCSVTHTNITLPSGSGSNTLYFPVVITQPYEDVQVNMYPVGQPRPGFNYSNTIYYQNNGLQTIANGTVSYTKDSNVSINSISQPGTTPTSNGFTYNFTNLAPFEVRYISVELSVPTIPTVTLGQIVTNAATIQIANDANLGNNDVTLSQVIVGSYDPNDKSESHGGRIGLDTFTNTDYLYYTINFENTGTANAEFIRVEDVLDAGLDESTFEMISASHTVNTKREGNQLTWHFYNINLPPTVNNPTSSHGYVHFKIKPKAGYAVGDIIPNTASIYFDYNPAIVTNTCNTEFFQTLGNPAFNTTMFMLSPNPAHHLVQITMQNTTERIENITIHDVLGKNVKSISNVNSNQTAIDVSALSKGVYLVEITSENHLKFTKKLIIQ